MKPRTARKAKPIPAATAPRGTRKSWLPQYRDARQSLALAEQALERTQSELATANRELSQKIDEVLALQAALERQAVRDFLTGLFNRRHLADVMPSMLALARRESQPLALALIDLDGLDAVNGRYGRATGDLLLAAFGKLLSTRMRKSDVVCRYGGEEFCALMPRTDARAAQRKIAALLRLWRTTAFPLGDAHGGTLTGLTFSAGLCDSGRADDSSEQMLRAAEAGMREAKRQGRDRVVVHSAASTAEPVSVPL